MTIIYVSTALDHKIGRFFFLTYYAKVSRIKNTHMLSSSIYKSSLQNTGNLFVWVKYCKLTSKKNLEVRILRFMESVLASSTSSTEL